MLQAAYHSSRMMLTPHLFFKSSAGVVLQLHCCTQSSYTFPECNHTQQQYIHQYLCPLSRGTIVHRTYAIDKKPTWYIFTHFYQQYLLLVTMVPRNNNTLVYTWHIESLFIPPGTRYYRVLEATFVCMYLVSFLLRSKKIHGPTRGIPLWEILIELSAYVPRSHRSVLL